jgi:hypothetical protein
MATPGRLAAIPGEAGEQALTPEQVAMIEEAKDEGRVKGCAPRDSRVKGCAPRDSRVKGCAPRDFDEGERDEWLCLFADDVEDATEIDGDKFSTGKMPNTVYLAPDSTDRYPFSGQDRDGLATAPRDTHRRNLLVFPSEM